MLDFSLAHPAELWDLYDQLALGLLDDNFGVKRQRQAICEPLLLNRDDRERAAFACTLIAFEDRQRVELSARTTNATNSCYQRNSSDCSRVLRIDCAQICAQPRVESWFLIPLQFIEIVANRMIFVFERPRFY